MSEEQSSFPPASSSSTPSSSTPRPPMTPSSSTSGSEGEGATTTTSTTVTTQVSRKRTKPSTKDVPVAPETESSGTSTPVEGEVSKQTTTVTHVGAAGLEHTVDKEGNVHLRPRQSPHSKKRGHKIRTVVRFVPRQSRLDSYNSDNAKDPFRGFYTLFWIGMGIMMLNTFYSSFTETGQFISLTFLNLFSRDAGVLALSDAVLVGHLFFCVPYAKALKWGWMSYWPTGVLIQHAWQGAMLACVIKWARYREWPWVQSGFFVLHAICMLMKMHSYLAVNGAMSQAFARLKRTEKMLEKKVMEVDRQEIATEDVTGKEQEQDVLTRVWTASVKKARKAAPTKAETEALEDKHHTGEIPSWTELQSQRGMISFRHKAFKGSLVRTKNDHPTSLPTDGEKKEAIPPTTVNPHVENSVHQQQIRPTGPNSANGPSSSQHSNSHEERIRDPHPLATHPDASISTLAREIESLREELISVAPVNTSGIDESDWESAGGNDKRVCWPANITFANFWDYLLVPTLVYELEYPRTKSIRPLYVLEKTLATFGTFFVIYVITEHFIIPHSPTPETPLLQALLKLALPMMINYLLIFYIMFECVCNGFAELTRFADREFYQDWWNATSPDQYNRKWNKPVHSFLLKHVYASSIASWGLSKTTAMVLTFLLSSFLHELVMAIVSGKIRGYLFLAQMSQMPLLLLSKVRIVRENDFLGNLIVWIGLMAGFPLLNIGYLMY